MSFYRLITHIYLKNMLLNYWWWVMLTSISEGTDYFIPNSNEKWIGTVLGVLSAFAIKHWNVTATLNVQSSIAEKFRVRCSVYHVHRRLVDHLLLSGWHFILLKFRCSRYPQDRWFSIIVISFFPKLWIVILLLFRYVVCLTEL